MSLSFETHLQQWQFDLNMQSEIFTKLARWLAKGISIDRALNRQYDIYTDDGRKTRRIEAIAIKAWITTLAEGKSFAVAIEGWVSPTLVGLIAAGEQGRRLSFALDEAVRLIEMNQHIRSKLRTALLQPLFLMIVALSILVLVGTFLLPMFTNMARISAPHPVTTAAVNAAGFLVSNWHIVLLAAILLISLTIYLLPRYTGVGRTFFDSLPVFKLYKATNAVNFMTAFNSMVSVGLGENHCLRLLRDTGTPWQRSRIAPLYEHMSEGMSFASAIKESGHYFPDKEVIGDILVFEEIGELSEGLVSAGEFLTKRITKNIEKFATLASRIGLISVFGVLLFVYAAAMLTAASLLSF